MTKKTLTAAQKPTVLREINGKSVLQHLMKKTAPRAMTASAKKNVYEKTTQAKKAAPKPVTSTDDICAREADKLVKTIIFLEQLCHKHGLSSNLEALQNRDFSKF
ncbi:unnamed protein product [Oikopleura dioica]|uniref:Uncharacterized protein n=1 Tax=Oikopleura dioica TaxID=34765 RepID=E4XBP8_OIKDI|nr:unnamed protein product [Oikopleura dioica]